MRFIFRFLCTILIEWLMLVDDGVCTCHNITFNLSLFYPHRNMYTSKQQIMHICDKNLTLVSNRNHLLISMVKMHFVNGDDDDDGGGSGGGGAFNISFCLQPFAFLFVVRCCCCFFLFVMHHLRFILDYITVIFLLCTTSYAAFGLKLNSCRVDMAGV